MVKILRSTKEIGECTTSLSGTGDPKSPESFSLNILTTNEGLSSFLLDSPKATMGESRVSLTAGKAIYSVTDIGGWTHLQISLNTRKKAVGLKMYKTLHSRA